MEKCANVENEDYVGEAMTLYLKDIKGLQILTMEEEVELAKAIEQGGEEGVMARETLIKANLRFVMFCQSRSCFRAFHCRSETPLQSTK